LLLLVVEASAARDLTGVHSRLDTAKSATPFVYLIAQGYRHLECSFEHRTSDAGSGAAAAAQTEHATNQQYGKISRKLKSRRHFRVWCDITAALSAGSVQLGTMSPTPRRRRASAAALAPPPLALLALLLSASAVVSTAETAPAATALRQLAVTPSSHAPARAPPPGAKLRTKIALCRHVICIDV